jgi:pilus assembly protein CpaB
MRPLYLVLALVVAGGLTFYINGLLKDQQAAPQIVQQVNPIIQAQTQSQILLANKHLPVGYLLKADDLVFKPWPADAIQDGFLKEEDGIKANDLLGSVVRVEIAAGEPIQRIKIVSPGERGFLAAVLKAGMKAVAIPVNNRTAVANLVMPGDRVDVMLTQTITKPSTQPGASGDGLATAGTTTEQITETIIYNARVLATGQALSAVQNNQDNQPEPAPATAYDTVTLELTPKLAEIVTLANELGRLSVVLNPLATSETDVQANLAAEERMKQWPYGISAIAGAGDASAYSITVQNEASPARKRIGSGDGSGISIYRGGEQSGVSAQAPASSTQPADAAKQ